MKRRLGLVSEQAVDPAVVLPSSERRPLGRRAIGVVSVVEAEAFVDALLEALDGAEVLSAPADTSADDVDRLIADAAEGEGGVVLACGEAVVGRARVDLLVAIDGGRHLADLPPVFRGLVGEAELVLGEPRLGTAKALAAMIQRADA